MKMVRPTHKVAVNLRLWQQLRKHEQTAKAADRRLSMQRFENSAGAVLRPRPLLQQLIRAKPADIAKQLPQKTCAFDVIGGHTARQWHDLPFF